MTYKQRAEESRERAIEETRKEPGFYKWMLEFWLKERITVNDFLCGDLRDAPVSNPGQSILDHTRN